jgi:hypothetical protein
MFPFAMVINLDKAGERGTHWVAIYSPNKRQVYYFDSLGRNPPPIIKEYMMKKFTHITYSNLLLQNFISNVCAHFCIYFIYNMSLGYNFDDLLKHLYNRTYLDIDLYIRSFVQTLIA